MRDCARLTRRPARLAFGAAPHGPFSKRVTKARGSQQQSLNACWARLSSRHAHARSLWNTSRKNRLVSMVGAGDSNSDLPFACLKLFVSAWPITRGSGLTPSMEWNRPYKAHSNGWTQISLNYNFQDEAITLTAKEVIAPSSSPLWSATVSSVSAPRALSRSRGEICWVRGHPLPRI